LIGFLISFSVGFFDGLKKRKFLVTFPAPFGPLQYRVFKIAVNISRVDKQTALHLTSTAFDFRV